MTRTQIAEVDRRRRIGLSVQSARRSLNLTQTEFAAACVPPLSARRLALLERGFGRWRDAEIAAVTALVPLVAVAFQPARAPRPLGVPVYPTTPETEPESEPVA